jgi:hypothetical protein
MFQSGIVYDRNSLGVVAIYLLAGLLLLTLDTELLAEDIGDWHGGFAQGIMSYRVENGPGNAFEIDCNEGSTIGSTGIDVTIIGAGPPPNSTVNMILDGDEIPMISDGRGSIGTDCHACADQFIYLWTHIRKSGTMLVQFANGASSKFSLNGAAKALGAKVCKTDFYPR